MASPDEVDPHLVFTVASVWREERISCPHPDLLRSFTSGGMAGGAAEFVAFHLRESQCPYCNAVVEAQRAEEDRAKQPVLEDLRDRLLRSTATELRRKRV
ncbi:MAG: hypothetical protein JNK49_00475 [Planctomycetes bacterium]|nr:hypothetical protein [Planctomycetota bacterium]